MHNKLLTSTGHYFANIQSYKGNINIYVQYHKIKKKPTKKRRPMCLQAFILIKENYTLNEKIHLLTNLYN